MMKTPFAEKATAMIIVIGWWLVAGYTLSHCLQ